MIEETSSNLRKGDWWRSYHAKTHVNRKDWGLGENALYFRSLMESMRQILKSCEERQDIIPYAQEYDWDESKLNEINQAAASDGVKMQKHNVLRGICRSHGDVYPTDIPYLRLDLSVMHDQGRYRDDTSLKRKERVLVYKLRVSKTDWITSRVKIPLRCQPVSWMDPIIYSKPLIYQTKSGGLMLQVSYETPSGKAEDYGLNKNRIFAIDLGQVRAFAGSWLDVKTGEWETDFDATRSTDHVNETLYAHCREISLIIRKNQVLAAIVKGQSTPNMIDVAAYERREEAIGFLREKITNEKNEIAWLISRDVVDHGLRHHCGMIKMEDLGFVQEAYGSKWAHGLVRDRLTERARAFGITVEVVPAGDSSHLDPFTMEYVEPRADWFVVTSGGVMDRDDLASLNLASRKSSRACRALKRRTGLPVRAGGQSKVRRDRRKVGPTPRRARPVSGRSRVRLLVRDWSWCFRDSGLRSVIVAVDCGSALPRGGVTARISQSTDPRCNSNLNHLIQ